MLDKYFVRKREHICAGEDILIMLKAKLRIKNIGRLKND